MLAGKLVKTCAFMEKYDVSTATHGNCSRVQGNTRMILRQELRTEVQPEVANVTKVLTLI